MDKGAWWAIIHGVTKSQTWFSNLINQANGTEITIAKCNKKHWPCRINLQKLPDQFSRSVVSDSLWQDGVQHIRSPCPSPAPGVYSNSCPLNQWCHPTISSPVIPFSLLQYFPASGSFRISHFFTSGGKVLEFQLQHQAFQWIFRTDFL